MAILEVNGEVFSCFQRVCFAVLQQLHTDRIGIYGGVVFCPTAHLSVIKRLKQVRILLAPCGSVGSRHGHLGYRFCGRFAVLRRVRFLHRSFLLLLLLHDDAVLRRVRFLRRSFLLLLLLHDGAALRCVLRRPRGRGE